MTSVTSRPAVGRASWIAGIRCRNSSTGNGASLDKDPTMNERPPNTNTEGFSLVTGPGRLPLTWHQVNTLGQVIGTVPTRARRR